MSTINFNGQNGAATSANVNVEVFYITAYGVKKVVNAFESVEQTREINRLISECVAYEKKDFNLYYKIGDFVGAFHLDKDYHSGNYILHYGNEQVDLHFTKLMGKNIDTLESWIFRAISKMFNKMCEQVAEQENEQEQENEDIDYLVTIFNEKMAEDISKDFEKTIQNIAEYGAGEYDTESEHICGMFNYERDYEHEWVEFYNENGNGGINHAYEIFRNAPDFTYVDFFDEDSACELVCELGEDYGVGVEDNSWGECLVWVKNPYYNAPKNDTPCLVDNVYYVNSEYDIDRGIERVADTIEKYLANYTPSYLDQFGDCVITVYWDSFSENDMKMLIENSIFALAVRDTLYERGVIENLNDFLVYDNGVYVTVDYDKMFNKVA